jgi:hypothetical protein
VDAITPPKLLLFKLAFLLLQCSTNTLALSDATVHSGLTTTATQFTKSSYTATITTNERWSTNVLFGKICVISKEVQLVVYLFGKDSGSEDVQQGDVALQPSPSSAASPNSKAHNRYDASYVSVSSQSNQWRTTSELYCAIWKPLFSNYTEYQHQHDNLAVWSQSYTSTHSVDSARYGKFSFKVQARYELHCLVQDRVGKRAMYYYI